MTAPSEAFLFLEPTASPDDRQTLAHDGVETLLVWVPDAEAAAAEAVAAVEAGVELIELYRGFGLPEIGSVLEAVGERVAVGAALVGSGTASPGRPARTATIFESGDADPVADRVVRPHEGGGSTAVLGASGVEAMIAAAVSLVDEGVELVEICGGTPLVTAAAVQRALGGRALVSHVGYPFESLERIAAYKASFG